MTETIQSGETQTAPPAVNPFSATIQVDTDSAGAVPGGEPAQDNSAPIPFERFVLVNDRMKAAEERAAALEMQYQQDVAALQQRLQETQTPQGMQWGPEDLAAKLAEALNPVEEEYIEPHVRELQEQNASLAQQLKELAERQQQFMQTQEQAQIAAFQQYVDSGIESALGGRLNHVPDAVRNGIKSTIAGQLVDLPKNGQVVTPKAIQSAVDQYVQFIAQPQHQQASQVQQTAPAQAATGLPQQPRVVPPSKPIDPRFMPGGAAGAPVAAPPKSIAEARAQMDAAIARGVF